MARYWFRPKRSGYGATPNTWQGWLFMAVLTVLILAIVLSADFIRDNILRALWIPGGLAVVVIPALIIGHRKTEGGWRWRSGD